MARSTSTGFGVADGDTTSAGSTVNVNVELAFCPRLSVTVRVTENDPLTVGAQLNVADVLEQPVGSPVHA